MRTIYFDYNATTPLDTGVREAMLPYLSEIFGNPSSVHQVGRRARSLLDDGRDRTAQVLGCKPSEVIFTSGGTESVNLAIFGGARSRRSKGKHLVTSAVEHDAVLHACQYLVKNEDFELTVLPVDASGRVSVGSVSAAIRSDTVLVSVMAANNEIGTIQPVSEIGGLCRERGILFHTDAVQWFGKEPFDSIHQFNADLVSICAHKFHGPKGAGILFARSPFLPDPIIFGGGHENERRAGTENLAAIMGAVTAIERFVRQPVFDRSLLLPLKTRLEALVDGIEGAEYVGSRENGLANTVSFVVRNADSIALLAGLDLEGICASSGSACSAGSLEPSHVISALGIEAGLAKSLVRLSLGRETTADEVDHLEKVLPVVSERVRRRAR
jgi:cysteine desulfurase